MKKFMLLFDTFPWLDDPVLILVLIAVGFYLRFGSRMADDVLETFKELRDRFKRKS